MARAARHPRWVVIGLPLWACLYVRKKQIALVRQLCEPSPLPMPELLSQRNTPALFGAKLIDDISDEHIIATERGERIRWGMAPADSEDKPVGRASRLPDGKLGRFGWKGQSARLASFVRAACANELGLGNSGQTQPAPLFQPNYKAPGNDLTDAQCDQLTEFIASLPRPREDGSVGTASALVVKSGRNLFQTVGCADCHVPDMGGVAGMYSDLLLHRMGQDLEGGGSYNETPGLPPQPSSGDSPPLAADQWRTPPLWGVADSAPYLHDGRAATLEDAILLHGGQGTAAAQRFGKLATVEQVQLVTFLKSLRAPTEQ